MKTTEADESETDGGRRGRLLAVLINKATFSFARERKEEEEMRREGEPGAGVARSARKKRVSSSTTYSSLHQELSPSLDAKPVYK